MKTVKMLLQNKRNFVKIKVFAYLAITIFTTPQRLFTSEIKIKDGIIALASHQTCWIVMSTKEPHTTEREISLTEGIELIARQQQKDHATISRIRTREASYLETLKKSIKEHTEDLQKFIELKRKVEIYIEYLEAHYACNLARVAAGFEPHPLDKFLLASQEKTTSSQEST